MTKIKICGITTRDALDACVDAKADFIGFVFFAKSPRNIGADQAAAFAGALPPSMRSVGLFVDPKDEELSSVFAKFPMDMIQLHGNEDARRIADIKSKFKVPVLKALKVAAPEDLIQLGDYQAVADWIIFDAKAPASSDLPGGNGLVFDWRLLKNLKIPKPWMLSGGLTPDNVKTALGEVTPDAVDVSSGVEDAPGIKNPAKIKAFIELVKSA